ncbi:hypothetical protein BGZ99_001956 [Dissophora globulifera]|uniref:Uncharacterized protein n=1 Tax=Dissophora globulifera TaxID=979702 RepID=A0A9P6RR06_9FUNG|nr:hypothetical protein BGZ99_001956 [Dissophora globulifera]
MLSLIPRSSSPCLHPHTDSFVSPPSKTGTSAAATTPTHCAGSTRANAKLTAVTSPALLATVPASASSPPAAVPTYSTASPAKTRPAFKSSSTAPLNNTTSYKEIVAHFTAKAPQPYGIIPPRKKRGPGLARSSSTSSITTTSSNEKALSTSPPSPTETSRNSVELQPTRLSRNGFTNAGGHANQTQIMQPWLLSLQSLLPESTSSSTRLGFWANLKAHYFSASTINLSWGSGNNSSNAQRSTPRGSEEFSPPMALRLSNSTPVAAVNATAPLSASLTLTDDLLSLPNVAAPSANPYYGSGNFPVSVAAMGRFKPMRTDTIPLTTFTYHETPVVERPQPLPLPRSLGFAKRNAGKMTGTLSPLPVKTSTKNVAKDNSLLLPALPRHLATRETRSNTDYLRMMAAELRMIRSRKLVSPLKPRGYLPRRKDPFRRAKSSLSNSIELPREEDDHPLNDVMVGSWTSVSSTDSFVTASSSEYQSAGESFY